MNKVIMPEQEASKNMTLSDWRRTADYGYKHTAFIGQCGTGPSNALYLITSNCVVLAERPTECWDFDGTRCTVDRFVDIEIRVLP